LTKRRSNPRNKKPAEPLYYDVGDRLRLIPFQARGLSRSDRLELIIDPGPAFGIGDHPTTVMALTLLEVAVARLLRQQGPPTLLDVGTGTGVLAIAGKALGAGFTVALDTDFTAVATAKRNACLNRFGQEAVDGSSVQLLVGGVDAVVGEFDLVVANLVAPVLLRLRERLESRVGKLLILSGIAEPMMDEVVGTYGSGTLNLVTSKQEAGWNAVLFARSP
jgi:ribosomal protein L11 methyltransferase